MSVTQTTTNRGYQLPHSTNTLAEDVQRLRAALASIDTDVHTILAGAPAALDTLAELAAALNNDASFAATVSNLLALKANVTDVYTKAQADARYVQGTTQTEVVFAASAGQTAFTLTTPAASPSSILVTVDGLIQPTNAYSLSQDMLTLTLSEAPATGATVRVLALGVAGSTTTPPDASVTTPKLADGAVTAAKLGAGAATIGKAAALAIVFG